MFCCCCVCRGPGERERRPTSAGARSAPRGRALTGVGGWGAESRCVHSELSETWGAGVERNRLEVGSWKLEVGRGAPWCARTFWEFFFIFFIIFWILLESNSRFLYKTAFLQCRVPIFPISEKAKRRGKRSEEESKKKKNKWKQKWRLIEH